MADPFYLQKKKKEIRRRHNGFRFVLLAIFQKDLLVQWSFARIVKSMSDENAEQRQTYMKTNEIRALPIEQFCAKIFLRTKKRAVQFPRVRETLRCKIHDPPRERNCETPASHFPRSSEIECDPEENV